MSLQTRAVMNQTAHISLEYQVGCKIKWNNGNAPLLASWSKSWYSGSWGHGERWQDCRCAVVTKSRSKPTSENPQDMSTSPMKAVTLPVKSLCWLIRITVFMLDMALCKQSNYFPSYKVSHKWQNRRPFVWIHDALSTGYCATFHSHHNTATVNILEPPFVPLLFQQLGGRHHRTT